MKRRDQEEFSEKLSYYGFIGILIVIVIIVLTN